MRPLATLTHMLDYCVWPDWTALMHVQSLMWFALLIWAAAVLYRRVMSASLPAWVVGLAAAVAVGVFLGRLVHRSVTDRMRPYVRILVLLVTAFAALYFLSAGCGHLAGLKILSGTNALTMDGKLVNVDGIGNRVAGLIFGGKKVIAVVGANKIVKNVDEALERIRNISAPKNAKRHQLKHMYPELPCVTTGQCMDCRHEMRICCNTVIIEHQMSLDPDRRMNIVIVGEVLGI